MAIDDRTTNRSYKLPNAGNFLADDVVRLRDALAAIDADVFARYTKLEVDQLISNLIGGAPGALDTLNELADALGDDANFAATVASQLALKANASNVYSKAESDARYVQGSVQTEMVFTATANQSVFTLATAVINKPSALVTVDGVVQPTAEYSLNMTGTQLTLSEGVPAGTVVRVLALGVASQGAPADDTVTEPKLRTGAVSTRALAEGIAPIVSSLNGGPLAGTRNRIINGDMRIDQRNAGAAVSVASGYQYPVDRFRSFVSTATARWQSQRSTDAPTGFTNSFQVTVTTTQSSFAVGDLGVPLEQAIEGFNTADLNWGTVNAASVTLSFWVKASVTGNYAAAFFNFNGSTIDRSYVTSFAVNVANTWEYKTITVPGDTTGTWQAGNLQGIFVALAAAGGSNNLGTANTWQAGLREYPSGTVNIFATNGATIRFTGVQLEPGTVATPFERRSYGQELALCQRYYEAQNDETYIGFPCPGTGGFAHTFPFPFKVQKRASPTIIYNLNNAFNVSASGVVFFNTYAWSLQVIGASFTNTTASTNFRASAEL